VVKAVGSLALLEMGKVTRRGIITQKDLNLIMKRLIGQKRKKINLILDQVCFM
jgi:hypothetical protein